MKAYKDLSKEELLTLQKQLNKEYEEAKAKGLKLDVYKRQRQPFMVRDWMVSSEPEVKICVVL